MGWRFSDVNGGKEAIGGGHHKTLVDGAPLKNDAVDFFYKTKGFKPLFTQLEVYICISLYIQLSIIHT